ncbi:polysaccharide biosynthesis tyrosine autokinase [Klebsiella pneumoniae]|jgi:tyrosine-protein kinase Etk/Wzc|uniref:polysaccharide biosynthesis tyrosine autokinase n=1 Tax=Klebsiella pneumoniae TaxID=573 RepID=UPI0007CD1A6D|nr:polysaccharide biosynthesis tyrosine autokinase [Klebsiella pneumoniae]EKZ6556064.1 polysaccharide biosynthesis tyrosine autokinase [Klebsiella pneumoniae]MBC4129654.1 polysaccharide biosynthesis tyrosine autokinase [Klebsiella pneumoniae]MDE4797866.1 polysaccharide biosynthesis tyrosine autokinase [Klebsiella pneumoniae]MDT9788383.1 polysaccharide biosynthesis tyrosine autokinase [Klebsiella pneumoniae]MDT9882556.1 polysaccharide biosynthesis tyrosine autokinase [Klebsiella pneumoniae]
MTSVMNNKPSPVDSDDIDLGRLIGELIDHRKLIVAITTGFTVIAVFYALLATPIYQANALVQVEQKQGNTILSNLSQILPDSQPQSAPEITLLQSRMILGKTVDDLGLQTQIKQKFFPVIGRGLARIMGNKLGAIEVKDLYLPDNKSGENPEVILTVIDKDNYSIEADGFDFNAKVGELVEKNGMSILVTAIEAEPGSKFSINYLTRLKAMNMLQNSFGVADQGKDTGMLTLTMTGDNPQQITKILDSISQNYLAQNVERQAAQDAKSLDFLNQQLPKVRNDLDQAEDKLNAYRKQRDSVDLTMEAKSVLDQIVNVDNQLNEITFREAEISQLYTKEHPTYKALMEKRQTLQNEKTKLNKKVSSMPSTQQEVLRLSRDVESGRAVYLQLLNRQQELNIAKSSAIGNVRIIDNAVSEPKPIKPNKPLIVVVGFIFGLLFSVGMVLLRILLRRGIESPEQLEEMGINVYASVPVSEWLSKNLAKNKINRKESDILLAVENPADLAVEAIRGLRTSLHFAMMEAKNNILMISGASPNAGKTFISTNLAATIALTGKKVLFIDADLRKGYVHKMFGGNNEHGLSDILSGQTTLDNSLKHVKEGGFDYIGRGAVPPNPAELLMHPRFETLLKKVSNEYDLVIIDTPPILAVTDAAIIGRYAGTTLLVARFEINTPKELMVSVKRFEQSGITIKGCILNGIVKKASSYYGYGYSHYGYSYEDKK